MNMGDKIFRIEVPQKDSCSNESRKETRKRRKSISGLRSS